MYPLFDCRQHRHMGDTALCEHYCEIRQNMSCQRSMAIAGRGSGGVFMGWQNVQQHNVILKNM